MKARPIFILASVLVIGLALGYVAGRYQAGVYAVHCALRPKGVSWRCGATTRTQGGRGSVTLSATTQVGRKCPRATSVLPRRRNGTRLPRVERTRRRIPGRSSVTKNPNRPRPIDASPRWFSARENQCRSGVNNVRWKLAFGGRLPATEKGLGGVLLPGLESATMNSAGCDQLLKSCRCVFGRRWETWSQLFSG